MGVLGADLVGGDLGVVRGVDSDAVVVRPCSLDISCPNRLGLGGKGWKRQARRRVEESGRPPHPGWCYFFFSGRKTPLARRRETDDAVRTQIVVKGDGRRAR